MDGFMTQSGDISIDWYSTRVGSEADNMVRKHLAEAMAKPGQTEWGEQGGRQPGWNITWDNTS